MHPPHFDPTIRLFTEEDVHGVYELSRACFVDRANTEAFIRRRYAPHRQPAVRVVLAEADGLLIGAQAVTLLPFFLEGREEPVAVFTDGMTHPNYRNRGVFRRVLHEAQQQAFDLGAAMLMTMPNDASLPAFRKSGLWQILPDRYLHVLPLDMPGFFRDRGLPSFLAAGLGLLSGLRLLGSGAAPAEGVREVADLTCLAADLNTLAAAAARRIGGMMCRRDLAFLRWRFCGNPTWQYRYFISYDPAGRVQGYIVTTTERRLGTLVSYLVDMLCVGSAAVPLRLVSHAASTMRAGGARLFGIIASSAWLESVLRKAGFWKVPQFAAPRRFHTAYAVNPRRPDLATLAARTTAWFLSLADFDTI